MFRGVHIGYFGIPTSHRVRIFGLALVKCLNYRTLLPGEQVQLSEYSDQAPDLIIKVSGFVDRQGQVILFFSIESAVTNKRRNAKNA